MTGFSLIEMMISITVGLMIVAALVGVVVSNSKSSKSNDKTSELQSNGRYALDFLRRELRHAGYRGYTWAEPNPATITTAITNECSDGGTANAFVRNIRQGVWGANDTNPFGTNDCITNAPSTYVRGDILAIRRLGNTPIPTASLTAGTLYFRSSYSAGQMFQGTTVPSIAGTLIDNFAVQEAVYYIGEDDNDNTIPALRRITLQGGAMVDEIVVSGIEHLQLQYGSSSTDLNTQYFNANNIAGISSPTDDPGNPGQPPRTDWEDVNAVRIWLLARNSKPEVGYINTTNYVMGDVTYTPPVGTESFRRQLFTAVVQLRNWGR